MNRRKHDFDGENQMPKKGMDEESLGQKEKISIKLFGVWELSNYSTYKQFTICVSGVFLLYLSHGYFQESIYSTPGFKFGFYASLFDFFIFIILSLLQISITTKEIPNEVPKKQFLIISIALMVSLGFGNSALAYLNYPTKVLFKSAKLIPTMILGIWITKRVYSVLEYVGALLLCAGLTAFTIGGASISPSFQMAGIFLVSISVISEAILSNVQEKVFANYHCKLLEMVLYSNLISFGFMFFVVLFTGEFMEATHFCMNRPQVMFALFGEAFVGYLGVHFYLALIKRFGAVVTIIVASLRKVFTIFLSFFIFPKPFTWMYVFGGILVFGSMFLNVYVKNQYEIKSYLQKREYHAKRGYFQKVAQFV